MSRFSQDQLFFFSVEIFKIEIFQSRFRRVKIFVKIVETRWDCQDLLRRVEIFEICQDAVKICRDAVKICQEILTLSRPFESENNEKSHGIEKSRRENTKIHALLDPDRDKLSRNAEIFRSRQNSWSRSRFFGLDVDVETYFLTLSRFTRLSRLTLWRRRDQESRSRPRWDKLTPRLRLSLFYLSFTFQLKI